MIRAFARWWTIRRYERRVARSYFAGCVDLRDERLRIPRLRRALIERCRRSGVEAGKTFAG